MISLDQQRSELNIWGRSYNSGYVEKLTTLKVEQLVNGILPGRKIQNVQHDANDTS